MAVGISVLFCSSSHYSLSAKEEFDGGKLLAIAVENQKKEFISKIENRTLDISKEEEQALEDNEKVMEQVIETDNISEDDIEYADYFGGTYIDDEDNLVVQVTKNATKTDRKEIDAAISDETKVETVGVSYADLLEAYNLDSDCMEKLCEKVQDGTASEEEKILSENLISIYVSQKRNANIVIMKEVTEELKELFYSYFGDKHVIFEKAEEGSEPKFTATTLKAGNRIYAYWGTTSQGKKCYGFGSLGPRVYYLKSDGSKVKGFLTAAHLVPRGKGSSVYINTTGNYRDLSLKKIGVVARWKCKGVADVAFIKITNTKDFKTSRYTAYSGPGIYLTNEKYSACREHAYAYVDEVVEGEMLYSCCYFSYLTKGKIMSKNCSFKMTSVSYVSLNPTEVLYTLPAMTLKKLICIDNTNATSGSLLFRICDKKTKTFDILGIASGVGRLNGIPAESGVARDYKGFKGAGSFHTSIERYDEAIMELHPEDGGYYQY